MSLKSVIQALVRRGKPVHFVSGLSKPLNDRVNIPISSEFGLERGQPIDRFYIESFLRDNQSVMHGNILEVGEIKYAHSDYLDAAQFEPASVRYLAFQGESVPGSSFSGDLTKPESLPKAWADCFICTQTLNFIFDFQKAFEGIYAILKPGGVALITVAGISQISRYDMDRWGDYWRFTSASIKRLLDAYPSSKYQMRTYGNALSAQLFLQGVAVEDLPNQEILNHHHDDYQVIIGVVWKKG